MDVKFGFLLVCSLVLQLEASAQEGTPVLFWSPEKSMSNLPEVGGVDPVSADLLVQQYLKPLMHESTESAVVFLQNKLHVDDFTKFADVYSLDSNGGAFKNIKGFIEEHFSLELPQVEDPLQAVEKLKSVFPGPVHTANTLEAVEKLNIGPSQKFLLVVELVPSADIQDEEQAIASNDGLVGAICNHLRKRNIKYTAMFTGKSASEIQSSKVETHSGRHLLAAPAEGSYNGTFMNVSGGIYLFLRDVQVYIKQKGVEDPIVFNLTVSETSADNSTADNNTAVVQFDLSGSPDNGTGDYGVQILFNTTRKSDRWVIEKVLLTVQGLKDSGANGSLTESALMTNDMDLVIPILYSYHCSSMKMYVDTIRHKDMQDYEGTYVVLNGLQMQPFNVQHDAFFNAQDCVGFFSRAIWMGIFSSLILLAILFFGVMMVLNLSTPDRFDDPKGKTIVIAQAED